VLGAGIYIPGRERGRDLYEEARRLTLDIVLRVTFGARIERSDELSDVIGEFITQTVNVANEVPPWWAVGASLSYRKVQRSLPVIRDIIVEIVQQRREQLAANGGDDFVRDGDLLGELLMEAEGRAMSDDDILYVSLSQP
jgi:cytochrome P450